MSPYRGTLSRPYLATAIGRPATASPVPRVRRSCAVAWRGSFKSCGAQAGPRTPMTKRPPDLKSGASPNSATWAHLKQRWCERQGSNLHAFRRMILSHGRLPVPPRSHEGEGCWSARRESNSHAFALRPERSVSSVPPRADLLAKHRIRRNKSEWSAERESNSHGTKAAAPSRRCVFHSTTSRQENLTSTLESRAGF